MFVFVSVPLSLGWMLRKNYLKLSKGLFRDFLASQDIEKVQVIKNERKGHVCKVTFKHQHLVRHIMVNDIVQLSGGLVPELMKKRLG